MPKAEKCSKCEADLDTTGSPKWCKKCRAAYKKEYQDGLEDRAEKKGFARGVTACLGVLRSAIGSRACTGEQAAQMVERSVTSADSYELTRRKALVQSLSAGPNSGS